MLPARADNSAHRSGDKTEKSLINMAPKPVTAPNLEVYWSDDDDDDDDAKVDEKENVQQQLTASSRQENQKVNQPFLPTIIETTAEKDPNSQSKLGFRIKRGVNDGILIYHVEKDYADSGLSEGDEILAVNGEKVYEPLQCLSKLLWCFENGKKAQMLVSKGERPRGYSYILAKKTSGISSSSSSGNVIDGLRLVKKAGQKVKVAKLPSFTSSSFHGVNVNKGDVICAINGIPITSILWAKIAWKVASGPLVPILTYNIFRRFRLALMTYQPLALKVKDGETIGLSSKIEDEYDIHEKLGEGTYSVVKRATHKASGESVGIKVVDRKSLSISENKAIQNEINILKELNHPNTLKLHNMVATLSNYYLVTECLDGGELFDHVVGMNDDSYNENKARDICVVLLNALSYLHAKGIAHRDLNPQNILLKRNQGDCSDIKIVDFGYAKEAPDDHSLITMCGSPGFIAPEILRRAKYGTKADMWSIGVVMFTMIGGLLPFESNNEQSLHRLTKAGKLEFDAKTWENVSKGAKDTILSLLETNPGRRASAKAVLSHGWFLEDSVLLQKISLLKSQKLLRSYMALSKFKDTDTVRVGDTKFARNTFFSFSRKESSKLQTPERLTFS